MDFSFRIEGTAHEITTWYVDDDNCPGPGAGLPNDPFCTIQDGIDTANNTNTVLVSPGTYNEAINFNGKAITLRSLEGPDVTPIDGSGPGIHSVVNCSSAEGPNTVLAGFTVTVGTTSNGGGMICFNSSPTVTNCMFKGNSVEYLGGGMFNNYYSSPTISNCTFTGDSTDRYGAGMYNYTSSPTVVNCTFSGNTATTYCGGIYSGYASSPIVSNTILWGNNSVEIYSQADVTLTITHSDVQGGYAGIGNIDIDPMFEPGDSRLSGESPCIDKGDNSEVPVGVTSDLDGNPRIVNCTVDMGAYEDQTLCVDTDGDGVCDPCDMCPGYDDALPCPIPAVSECGMITLTLLTLTAATLVLSRRRIGSSCRSGRGYAHLAWPRSLGSRFLVAEELLI